MIKYVNKNINEYLDILKFFLPVALLIFGYWKGLKKKFKNRYVTKCILNSYVFKLCNQSFEICKKYFSLWPISHLLINILAVLRFKKLNERIFLFLLGVIWEIFEEKFFCLIKQEKIDNTFKKKHVKIINGKVQYDNWWQGTFSDIGFNFIGITIGNFISKYKILSVYTKRILNSIFLIGIFYGLFYIEFYPLYVIGLLLSLKYTFVY